MLDREGGITRQGGECAAGIFPLKGFFNSPALAFDLHQSEESLLAPVGIHPPRISLRQRLGYIPSLFGIELKGGVFPALSSVAFDLIGRVKPFVLRRPTVIEVSKPGVAAPRRNATTYERSVRIRRALIPFGMRVMTKGAETRAADSDARRAQAR